MDFRKLYVSKKISPKNLPLGKTRGFQSYKGKQKARLEEHEENRRQKEKPRNRTTE
jgi:hypothetical protein